jgi:hypothetical protein
VYLAKRTSRHAANLNELVVILLMMLAAIATASIGAERFGWPGGVVGFVLGPLLVLGFIFAILIAGDFIEGWSFSGIPRRPVCRNGTCRRDAYELRHFAEGEGKVFDWVCRCGVRYRKEGRRFFEVLSDGSVAAYRIWRPLRGWCPDSEQDQGYDAAAALAQRWTYPRVIDSAARIERAALDRSVRRYWWRAWPVVTVLIGYLAIPLAFLHFHWKGPQWLPIPAIAAMILGLFCWLALVWPLKWLGDPLCRRIARSCGLVCPVCQTAIFHDNLEYLQRTGKCPHCCSVVVRD